MKVQCSCGTKCAFDVTPEMGTRPIRFVCPTCGMDSSEFVNSLIRQEFGQTATPAGAPIMLGASIPPHPALSPARTQPPPPPPARVGPPPPPPPSRIVAQTQIAAVDEEMKQDAHGN